MNLPLISITKDYILRHVVSLISEMIMAQAKTLTEKELKKVLIYISLRTHAPRNRAMLLLTHWAGMRVGEVAALRIEDVVEVDGAIKTEIRLQPAQTKGRHARTVFLGERLQIKSIRHTEVTFKR